MFSPSNPADNDLIDGSIGEGSPFHQTFGYYAHGVSEETAVLPAGWRKRLVKIRNENTGGGAKIHDLAVSKPLAGREKDLDFLTVALRHRLANPQMIRERLAATPLDADRQKLCLARLQRLLS